MSEKSNAYPVILYRFLGLGLDMDAIVSGLVRCLRLQRKRGGEEEDAPTDEDHDSIPDNVT